MQEFLIAAQPEEKRVEPCMDGQIGGLVLQTGVVKRDGILDTPHLLQCVAARRMGTRKLWHQRQRSAAVRQRVVQLALRFEGIAQTLFRHGDLVGRLCLRQQLTQHRGCLRGSVHRQEHAAKALQGGLEIGMAGEHGTIALFCGAKITDLVPQDGEIESRLQHLRFGRERALQPGDRLSGAALGLQPVGIGNRVAFGHAGPELVTLRL